MNMLTKTSLFSSVIAASALLLLGSAQASPGDGPSIERGRYLVVIGGCNDCHTANYLLNDGQVPEDQWLEGNPMGWRGPWGTTYSPNLRLSVTPLTEDGWVDYAKALKTRPPMPWFALNQMTDDDLRSIYRYISKLGPGGDPAPAYVSPEVVPTGPYAQFPSPPPEE